MNLIEQKTYSDNIKNGNIDFNRIFCEIKESFNYILDLVENLTFDENYDENLTIKFFNICNNLNKDELILISLYMLSIGYGNIKNFLNSFNIKLTKAEIDEALLELGNNFNRMDFYEKLTVITSNNYIDLFTNISSNFDEHIEKVQKRTQLEIDELVYISNLNNDKNFEKKFNFRLKNIQDFNNQQNFSLIKYYQNRELENLSDIIMKIKTSNINKDFKIDFINSSGYLVQLIISEDKDKYNSNYIYNRNEFIYYLNKLLDMYLFNYNNNFIHFILFFSEEINKPGLPGGGKDIEKYSKVKVAA